MKHIVHKTIARGSKFMYYMTILDSKDPYCMQRCSAWRKLGLETFQFCISFIQLYYIIYSISLILTDTFQFPYTPFPTLGKYDSILYTTYGMLIIHPILATPPVGVSMHTKWIFTAKGTGKTGPQSKRSEHIQFGM